MIRVLYVSEALTRNSGVASVIMNLIENIANDNIKIDLLTYENGDSEILEKLRECGSEIYFIPELNIRSFFGFVQEVKNFFQRHKYDIVHSHFNQVDNIVFRIAKKNGVKVCVSHSHNTKLSDSKMKAIRNRLLCWNISKQATILAACSERAGVCLFGQKFLNSPKKLIIRNGVDCEKFKYNEESRAEIRKEFGFIDNDILIGTIGGFRLQKNHMFLIDVFYELHKCNETYKLLLVGDGELITSVKNKVKELGIQKSVIFAGTRTDVNKIMSALDLFVLPSFYEGLPVVGIEAQAAGLNCVFSDSITREVDLTNSTFLNLSAGAKEWCNIIKNMNKSRHIEYQKQIMDSGFDIRNECKRISDIYFKYAKER